MKYLAASTRTALLLCLTTKGACFTAPGSVQLAAPSARSRHSRCRRSTAVASTRQASDSADNKRRSKSGWHHRLTSVFRNPLQMKTAVLEEGADTTMFFQANDTASYLTNSFELQSPSTLFPVEPSALLGNNDKNALDPFGVAELPLVEATNTETSIMTEKSDLIADPELDQEIPSVDEEGGESTPSVVTGGSPLSRMTRGWYQGVLMGLLDRWSQGNHENLNVMCQPCAMSLLRGQARCDAVADFDRIVFGNIRMSGGRLEAHRLALNLLSFTPAPMPRYPDQFDFVASNVTFTQEDLFESSCIRNGLQRLLVRILKQTGVRSTTVRITQIGILPSNKLSIQGEATTLFNSKIPFAVRSGLGSDGRGHILTFPGLEMSLSPEIGLFIPILPEVTLDLGHNAQLLRLEIDGTNKVMRACARVTITPKHTRKVNYMQSPNALAALYSVDVGRWLTKLGRFSHA